MSFGRGAASAGLATALAVASFLWWNAGSAHPQPEAVPILSIPSAAAPGDPSAPTPTRLVTEIEDAQRAVIAQVGQPPYSGPIGIRPDFVSEFEWQVLEGVARTHADPRSELTLLVNRMRFSRLQTLWRSLRSSGADIDLRQRLGWQLLGEIPGRVSEHQLDLAQAQALQLQLLDDLVSDPGERIRRTSEESLRLSRPAGPS